MGARRTVTVVNAIKTTNRKIEKDTAGLTGSNSLEILSLT